MVRRADLGAVAIVVALAVPAAAGPTVEIRGRPSIALEPVRRVDGDLEIRGQVTELGSGEPLPGVDLDIELGAATAGVTTDDDGRFVYLADPGDGGPAALRIEYAGGERLAPAEVALDRLEVGKRPLALQLRVDSLTEGEPGLRVMVDAADDRGPVALRVSVEGGPLDAVPVALGTLETGKGGFGALEVPMTALGGPGRKLVVVAFPGDADLDAASAQAIGAIHGDTALSLSLAETRIRHAGRLAGAGRLTGAGGAPLSLEAVTVEGKGRALAEVLTDADGRFRFSIEAGELGPGPLTVQAVFAGLPGGGRHRGSRSPVLDALIEERRPVPVGLMLTAFAATVAAIGAFVILRTRPWERWFAAVRRRVAATDAAPASRAASAGPPAGLSLARPGLASTLRRAHDTGFTGTVCSAASGRPLPDAQIALRVAGEPAPRLALTESDGGFAFDQLPPGGHEVVVAAAGHVAERFVVVVPHRGELRGARVNLVPVRERIFALYREVAEPLLGRGAAWGVATPREIVDGVRARRPAPSLAALTDFVEERYFSQRTPEEGELAQAEAHVAAAAAEAQPPA